MFPSFLCFGCTCSTEVPRTLPFYLEMTAFDASLLSFVAHVANIGLEATAEEVEGELRRVCEKEEGTEPDDGSADPSSGKATGEATDAAFKKVLDCDSILEVALVLDKATGASRGFAFVTLGTAAERDAFVARTNGLSCSISADDEAAAAGGCTSGGGGAVGLVVSEAKPKPKSAKKKKDKEEKVDLGKGGRQWLAKAPKSKSKPKHKNTVSTDTNRRHFKGS